MSTSWQKSSTWYNSLVGDKGHYFHQHLIIPHTTRLLSLNPGSKLLDVGCGNGFFSKSLHPSVSYLGLDNSSALIKEALQNSKNPKHRFQVQDATNVWKNVPTDFTHALLILSLQNMEFPEKTLSNISQHLTHQGKLVIVLNHPCFRIPRQSEWGIDPKNNSQYRRINRYLSPLKIPITIHPGDQNSELTWSFHHSLTDYFKYLSQSGFVVTDLEEWASDKVSVGKAAKTENFTRKEIPLFLTLVARKS